MFDVAPASVLMMGVLGMLVIAVALLRMSIAEHHLRHDAPRGLPFSSSRPRTKV